MDLLDRLPKAKVLVLGDIMLDRYWWGTVTRISPEAPVPIVKLGRVSVAAGGAANVAVNLAGIGAAPILVGAVGCDPEAVLLRRMLEESGVVSKHLIEVRDRPTTVKTRIIAHSQQVARIDQEVDGPLTGEETEMIATSISRLINSVDAVVISDYGKGLLCPEVLASALQNGARTAPHRLVDPKGKNYSKYRGATVITPNRREAAEACNIEDTGPRSVEDAGRQLLDQHQFGAVLITRGEEGMTLFRTGEDPVHFEALARSVYDVTGAGDTVIATLAASVAAGADLSDAARLSNIAAGIVVEQVGTTAIQINELRAALNGTRSRK
ncbi:MAG TPA: D-glycero-beta-D-manno-heptose-7-phosphate kinase [Pyrinomonadaceae bacterium]